MSIVFTPLCAEHRNLLDSAIDRHEDVTEFAYMRTAYDSLTPEDEAELDQLVKASNKAYDLLKQHVNSHRCKPL